MSNHNRADLRDDIRRALAIIPPVDVGTGAAGALPPGQPDPDNPTINLAIEQAITAINRYVRVGPVQNLTMQVQPAQSTDRGVTYADLSFALPPGGTRAQFGGYTFSANEFINLIWTDANGNTNRLEPYSFYAKGKDYAPFQQYPPGVPSQFVLAGYQVGLMPPPLEVGTLTVTCASGMPGLQGDTDSPQYIAGDYIYVIVYWAVMILCARDAQDVEMQTRFGMFAPLATQGIVDLWTWRNGYDQKGIQSLQDTLRMIPLSLQMQRMAAIQGGQQNGNS